MPINVYTGLMRSGKSYEVVSEVILAAIASGRRVVTNVDGISNDLIREFIADTKNIPLDRLGTVVHCVNEDVFKEDFFPYYDDKKSAVTDTFVQPGDLVCIDEAWRFWGTDCKISKNHRSFFLEHGHFVHPVTFTACDLVLMIQDMGTLHRSVKAVVAFSFRTHKKVSLGMGNTYSVNMWEGSKMTKASLIGSWVRRYKKEIFPLYSSFKGGVEGKTVNTDKRQNTLKNPRLWIIVFIAIVGGWFAFANIWKFFNRSSLPSTTSQTKTTKPNTVQAQNSVEQSQHNKDQRKGISESWRIVGVIQTGDRYFVAIANPAGRIRLESPSFFRDRGMYMAGNIDGETVTVWSGLLMEKGNDMPKVPDLIK
jgi:zona occludens toxin